MIGSVVFHLINEMEYSKNSVIQWINDSRENHCDPRQDFRCFSFDPRRVVEGVELCNWNFEDEIS